MHAHQGSQCASRLLPCSLEVSGRPCKACAAGPSAGNAAAHSSVMHPRGDTLTEPTRVTPSASSAPYYTNASTLDSACENSPQPAPTSQ